MNGFLPLRVELYDLRSLRTGGDSNLCEPRFKTSKSESSQTLRTPAKQSTMCKWTRPFWGTDCQRSPPKAFPRLGLPLFAVLALRELESACTVCFSGVVGGTHLGSAVGTPPPPKPKIHPPLKRGILWTWFFLQSGRIFPGVHKIGAAISSPRIADKNFTDTKRIFFSELRTPAKQWMLSALPLQCHCKVFALQGAKDDPLTMQSPHFYVQGAKGGVWIWWWMESPNFRP